VIAVVDYGAGNVQSVVNALDAIYAPAILTNDSDAILAADGVIVPGVGAAQDTMRNLERHGVVAPLLDVIQRGTPYLGICMGMQALMTYSEEHGGQRCLDIIPGRVRRIETTLPTPHMGWNQFRPTPHAAGHPLLRGIPLDAHVYFVHSFVCVPSDPEWVLAETQYGSEPPFASILGRGNLMGTQFHPEKSGAAGLQLLRNFVAYVSSAPVSVNQPRLAAR
jgi:glutamine amidotransferase